MAAVNSSVLVTKGAAKHLSRPRLVAQWESCISAVLGTCLEKYVFACARHGSYEC